ncbi:MAG: DNA polymerase III subunit delta [Deltaproteobacteria bacterium]|nr:DNA polymerase III subunit delta [Deltaproteobacteria bacterium]
MTLKPIYYIYGSDDYLIDETLSAIKDEVLKGPFASMNYHSFDAKADPSDIVAAASTMPAFAEWRLVVVKGAENFKDKHTETLIPYIKRPSPSTCLVFVSMDAKLNRTSAFAKALIEGGYLKACERPSDEELFAWVRKNVKKEGKTISDGAVRKLVEIGGGKLRDIHAELQKIVLYAWEKPAIEEKDVEDAGLDCREESIFGLSDAIGAKDLKKALYIYEKISDEEPLKVLGSIARQIRTLLKIKALLKKGTPPDKLPSLLGLFPKYADGYLRRSRKFSERELKIAIEKLLKADSDLKSNRVPEPVILPRLIMELCG